MTWTEHKHVSTPYVTKPFAALFVNQKLVINFIWNFFGTRVSSHASFLKKKKIQLNCL